MMDNAKEDRAFDDDEPPLELQIVRDGEAPSRGGRPLFLTGRRFIRICRWIQKGESSNESCRRELVSFASFRNHVNRKPTFARRLKKAEGIREQLLREYHIANITKHAPKSILASLWWLERTDPGKFALRRVDRTDPDGSEQLIGDRIPADRVAKYGELMLEVAEENKARPLGTPPQSVELPDTESA